MRWTTALILYGGSSDSMPLASCPPPRPPALLVMQCVFPVRLCQPTLLTGHGGALCARIPASQLLSFQLFNRGFFSLRSSGVCSSHMVIQLMQQKLREKFQSVRALQVFCIEQSGPFHM